MNAFDLYRDTPNLARAEKASALEATPLTSPRGRQGEPGLSVVILTLDHADFLVPLVGQLLEQRDRFRSAGLDLQILIGDTGSTNRDLLRTYDVWHDGGDVEIIRGLDYHFSRCNNLLAERAGREVLLFLNNDIVLSPRVDGLLEIHRTLVESPEVGIAGAILFFPDGGIQCCGVDFFRQQPQRAFPFHPYAGEHIGPESLPEIMSLPATTGSFLAIRRDLFVRVGGFSEEYSVEAQDVDLCLRAHRLGGGTRVVNLGRTIHLENGTRPKGDEHWPDRRLFLRRWRSYVEANFL